MQDCSLKLISFPFLTQLCDATITEALALIPAFKKLKSILSIPLSNLNCVQIHILSTGQQVAHLIPKASMLCRFKIHTTFTSGTRVISQAGFSLIEISAEIESVS
jgi:hypothetical protein